MKRKRPELGDRAYRVEWCIEMPTIPGTNDADVDNAVYRSCVVISREEADKLAHEIYSQSVIGVVEICPVEFTDPYGDNIYRTFYWEAYADSDFYEGEVAPRT